jgi:hypothetical protein
VENVEKVEKVNTVEKVDNNGIKLEEKSSEVVVEKIPE